MDSPNVLIWLVFIILIYHSLTFKLHHLPFISLKFGTLPSIINIYLYFYLNILRIIFGSSFFIISCFSKIKPLVLFPAGAAITMCSFSYLPRTIFLNFF